LDLCETIRHVSRASVSKGLNRPPLCTGSDVHAFVLRIAWFLPSACLAAANKVAIRIKIGANLIDNGSIYRKKYARMVNMRRIPVQISRLPMYLSGRPGSRVTRSVEVDLAAAVSSKSA
jgi:hypothetical protein